MDSLFRQSVHNVGAAVLVLRITTITHPLHVSLVQRIETLVFGNMACITPKLAKGWDTLMGQKCHTKSPKQVVDCRALVSAVLEPTVKLVTLSAW
jgi:hypothetical protein